MSDVIVKKSQKIDPKSMTDETEDPEEALDRIAKTYGLSELQKNFVHHMVATDGKRTKAALAAGYQAENKYIIDDRSNQTDEAKRARNTLAVTTTGLMKSKKILNAIQEYKGIYKSSVRGDVERDIYNLLKTQVNFNPQSIAHLYTARSQEELKDMLLALPAEVALCIENVSLKIQGKFADEMLIDVKLVDRHKAADALSRLVGLNEKKKEETVVKDNAPIINIQVVNTTNSEL